jgi:hypothetical protein
VPFQNNSTDLWCSGSSSRHVARDALLTAGGARTHLHTYSDRVSASDEGRRERRTRTCLLRPFLSYHTEFPATPPTSRGSEDPLDGVARKKTSLQQYTVESPTETPSTTQPPNHRVDIPQLDHNCVEEILTRRFFTHTRQRRLTWRRNTTTPLTICHGRAGHNMPCDNMPRRVTICQRRGLGHDFENRREVERNGDENLGRTLEHTRGLPR